MTQTPLRQTETVSVRPVLLPSPERGEDVQVRITAPRLGEGLPVVVFSHGYGSSMDGYGPLVDFWAASGLLVVQPTHLDSLSSNLAPDDARTPNVWRHRIADLTTIIDNLSLIAAAVPDLADRIDPGRVVVAGHSYGATTASALLGARVSGPAGDPEEDFRDERVLAGVLLCLAGEAGNQLSSIATQMFPFMRPKFDRMSTPALLAAGDADQSPLSSRGPDWWRDGYLRSPGDKSLLTLFGAKHVLGGIDSYRAVPQSEDDNPATVGLIQRLTTAYLHSKLGIDGSAWACAREALADESSPVGRVEVRQ